jgi:hypothetical protein
MGYSFLARIYPLKAQQRMTSVSVVLSEGRKAGWAGGPGRAGLRLRRIIRGLDFGKRSLFTNLAATDRTVEALEAHRDS